MNKKLLLGAALLVGLGTTLTSCVDTTESASVTNIRNAKAEQLKSIADYNKAQAEAALIIANAEKASQAASQAYQEAQAIYIKAQAEAELAQAEYLKAQGRLQDALAEYWKAQAAYTDAKTQNEKDRLAAELAKAEADLALAQLKYKEQEIKNNQAQTALENAQFELELKKQKLAITLAEAETQLKRLETTLADEQQALTERLHWFQDHLDAEAAEVAADEADKINLLLKAYKEAADALYDAQKTLALKKIALARIENHLVTAKEDLIAKITLNTNEKLALELENEEQQAIIDLFAEFAGKTVTNEDLVAALTARNNAENADKTAAGAKEDARKALDETYQTMTGDLESNEKGSYNSLVKQIIDNNFEIINVATMKPRTAGYWGSYELPNEQMGEPDTYYYKVVAPDEVANYSAPASCIGKYTLVVYTLVGPLKDTRSYISYEPIFEGIDVELNEVENSRLNSMGEEVKYTIYAAETVKYKDLIAKGLDAWKACVKETYNTKVAAYDEATLQEDEENYKNLQEAASKAYDDAVKADEEATAAYETAVEVTLPDLEKKAVVAYKAWQASLAEEETPATRAEEPAEGEDAGEEDPLFTAWKEALEAFQAMYKDTYESGLSAYTLSDEEGQPVVTVDVEYKGEESLQAKAAKASDDVLTKLEALEIANEDYALAQQRSNSGDAMRANLATYLQDANDTAAQVVKLAPVNGQNIENYKTACTDYAKADADALVAASNYAIALNEYNEIERAIKYKNGVLGGDEYANACIDKAKTKISENEGKIVYLEKKIDSDKADLANLDTVDASVDNQYYEDRVEELNAEINKATVALEVAQQKYDNAKAELDSYLKEQK